jgi:hypothetical protein
MSTIPSQPTPPGVQHSPGQPVQKQHEIKLIAHSNLFYWWPVWALAFLMALITWIENNRMVVVPKGSTVTYDASKNSYTMIFPQGATTASLQDAVRREGSTEEPFLPRLSQQAWPGALFMVGLLVTIFITNVPLRGLWSFLSIVLIVVLALFISLLKAWDTIFDYLGALHIHINMAGYLFIGIGVFVLWSMATFVFDRRSYIIFTPGQIRVCEHIGDSIETFPTIGVSMEKQRDDLFRHYILGFGSGDLIVRVSGAERREIRMPNILGIGWRLKTIEDMLRTMSTT